MSDSGDVGRRPRWRLALAGVLTGVLALVSAEATASALGLGQGPLLVVGAAVRDLTPGSLAVALVHLVGRADKPLLIGGTALLLLALTALAGVLTAGHRLLADLVFIVLGLVGVAAAVQQGAGTGAQIAAVVGLGVSLVALRLLTTPALGHTDRSRRTFLLRVVAGVVVAGVVGAAGQAAGSGRRAVEQARRRIKVPAGRGTVPVDADLGLDGEVPWRSPNSGFYRIDTALSLPAIDPEQWQLRIHGMVEKEITVGFADLMARRIDDGWVTLCCVSNEVGGDLIGNAFFAGVPVRELLAEAGVQDGADAVLQTSEDGWTCGTPLTALTDDRLALLAVAMNGEPLPVEHGFPVRMVVPGLYGYVSATKWIVDLEVTRFDRIEAYWTSRGWGEKGPVRTMSRIDVPRDGGSLATGRSRVGGVAWAQHTGITKVEVALDGGAWTEAELGGVPADDTWVQWAATLDLKGGAHEVRVRATDKSGYTQTGERRDVLPDGATGWHTVGFDAV